MLEKYKIEINFEGYQKISTYLSTGQPSCADCASAFAANLCRAESLLWGQTAVGVLVCDSTGCVLIHPLLVPTHRVVSGLSQETSQHFACGQHQGLLAVLAAAPEPRELLQ